MVNISGIFSSVLLIFGMGDVITIEHPLLSTHNCQLLPLAISQLVGNNKELDVSGII